MNILLWIIFGALAGWIASMVMKTDGQQDGLMNVVVGIVGAFLGGWLMNQFGSAGVTGFNLYSLVVAVLGSVILIAIVKMIRK